MDAVRRPIKEALVFVFPWFAAGLAIRLWRVSLQLVMFRDETTYAYQIKHVLDGSIFRDATYYTFPPSYPFLAAPIAFITGNPEFAGRLISCLAGAGTAFPVYYLAKGLFGRRTAVAAAAAVALFPPLMSIGVMSEPTYGFFLALSMYLGLRAFGSAKGKDYLFFGLCMGVTYLSRPEGFFVFFAWLAFCLAALVKARAGLKKSSSLAALAFAGFMLLSFPYMLQLRAHFGAWEISGKTRINLAKVKAAETLPPGESFDRHADKVYAEFEKEKKGLAANLAEELSSMAGRYPANLAAEMKQLMDITGYLVLLAAAVGLFEVFRLVRPLSRVLLLLTVFVPLLLIPAVFILDRIIIPYVPVVLAFSAYGAIRVLEVLEARAERAVGRQAPAQAVTACAAVFLLFGQVNGLLPETDVRKTLDRDDGYRYYYVLRQLAEQVKPYIRPGAGIITRNNIYAYYAGGEYLAIPSTDMAGLLKFAKDIKAEYLFYGPMEQDMRPELMPYIFRDGVPADDPAGDGRMKLVFAEDYFLLYKFDQEKL